VLPLAALSDKDRKDLEFACELGVDWLALSFVQRPEDLMEARELARGRAAILSKIEKPSAVERFNDILNVSDGIMVARGDLGVELPVQNVPPIQIHDRKPDAHPRRSVRRGNRDLRRRRCHHVVGGIRGRQLSD
jgi:pyruvate kinase